MKNCGCIWFELRNFTSFLIQVIVHNDRKASLIISGVRIEKWGLVHICRYSKKTLQNEVKVQTVTKFKTHFFLPRSSSYTNFTEAVIFLNFTWNLSSILLCDEHKVPIIHWKVERQTECIHQSQKCVCTWMHIYTSGQAYKWIREHCFKIPLVVETV